DVYNSVRGDRDRRRMRKRRGGEQAVPHSAIFWAADERPDFAVGLDDAEGAVSAVGDEQFVMPNGDAERRIEHRKLARAVGESPRTAGDGGDLARRRYFTDAVVISIGDEDRAVLRGGDADGPAETFLGRRSIFRG